MCINITLVKIKRGLKRFVLAIFLIHATQTSAITGSASWDIDKDGHVDALTDALILIRHLFDVSGDNLFTEAVSLDSPLDNDGIVNYNKSYDRTLNGIIMSDISGIWMAGGG